MKTATIKTKEGRHYVQAWITSLHGLLGWPEDEALKWASKWKTQLNDPDSLLFHEPPTWYVLNLLIPESMKKELAGAQLALLRQTLLGVIEHKDSMCDRNPDFDWRSAKSRVKLFLDKVDKKLGRKSPITSFLISYQNRFLVGKPSKSIGAILRESQVRGG